VRQKKPNAAGCVLDERFHKPFLRYERSLDAIFKRLKDDALGFLDEQVTLFSERPVV
jgi:hypothetical protein